MFGLQFFKTLSLKGGPALSTTPASMYSKQEVKNKTVLSEFLIFDLSWLICGGIYLSRWLGLQVNPPCGGCTVSLTSLAFVPRRTLPLAR